MKLYRPLLVLVTALAFKGVSTSQQGDLECEKIQEVERKAEKSFEQTDTRMEREKLERKFERKMDEARQKCAEEDEGKETGEDYREKIEETDKPREGSFEKMGEKKCREKASEIKESFVSELEDSSFRSMGEIVDRHMSDRAKLISRCEIYEGRGRGSGGTEPGEVAGAPQERKDVELDYSLPPKTSEKCRARVSDLENRYEERIKSSGSRDELRNEFYTRVENELENCEPGMKIVNVSEAPSQVPESCKRKMRELNSEIRKETGASVGSEVPEEYRKRYRKRIEGCMTGMIQQKVTDRIRSEIMSRIPGKGSKSDGNGNKIQKKLNKKEKRIQELKKKLKQKEARNRSERTENKGKSTEASAEKEASGGTRNADGTAEYTGPRGTEGERLRSSAGVGKQSPVPKTIIAAVSGILG
ncbi:MAG: hypothetical protein ABEJ72_11285 [Candidatus Aenigmatarchaeota archaeon]